MFELVLLLWCLSPFLLGFLLLRCWRARKAAAAHYAATDLEIVRMREEVQAAQATADAAKLMEARAAPYLGVADAADAAALLASEAAANARAMTERTRARVLEMLAVATAEAAAVDRSSKEAASQLIAEARVTAGEAIELKGRERELRAMVLALENRLRGYDDSYLQPASLLLEGLADSYGSATAAMDLKAARNYTRTLLRQGKAAQCDYVEANRRETAVRFVADAFNGAADSVLARVKVDNVGKLTQELEDAAATVNMHGSAFRNARVTAEYVAARRAELIAAARFQELLKRESEEQRAIRERMREEARAQRDFELAKRTAARDEERVRKALAEAERRYSGAAAEDRAKFEAQLAQLRGALAEAEAKSVRALSMAQQTRAGHCYVISNEGSFGDEVLKIGMTRRLDPLDRVRELGDASVPFEFDVHAMIFSDDAPGLEKLLHREFNAERVNMVNPRKEFFKVGLAAVREKLGAMGVRAEFTMTASAQEFRETQTLRLASVEQRRAALAAVLAAEEKLEEEEEEAIEGADPEALTAV